MVAKVIAVFLLAVPSLLPMLVPGAARAEQEPGGLPSDCKCAPYGVVVQESGSCGSDMPTFTTVYDVDSTPGQCDGNVAPCPKVKDCKSSIAVTVTPKPLTGLRKKGTTGAPLGTFTEIFYIDLCGELDSEEYEVINQVVSSPDFGKVICTVLVKGGCPFCKERR